MKTSFTWHVWNWDFNHDRLEKIDIVPSLLSGLKALKPAKRPKDREGLDKWLKHETMYRYWSKCEYETLVGGLFTKDENFQKIDVYDQLEANWDNFVDLFWEKAYAPKFAKGKK